MSTVVFAVVDLWGYNAIHLRIYHKGPGREFSGQMLSVQAEGSECWSPEITF